MKKSKVLYRIAFSLGLIALPFVIIIGKDSYRNPWIVGGLLALLLPIFGVGIYAAHLEQKEKMNKAECPEFDYFNYEPILEWAKAKVEYDDTFANPYTGEKRVDEKNALWILFWDHGFIGFDSVKKREDEAKARMAAALFIYLWCKGVPAELAHNCASLYARHIVQYRC